jgi:hypothetical protein
MVTVLVDVEGGSRGTISAVMRLIAEWCFRPEMAWFADVLSSPKRTRSAPHIAQKARLHVSRKATAKCSSPWLPAVRGCRRRVGLNLKGGWFAAGGCDRRYR